MSSCQAAAGLPLRNTIDETCHILKLSRATLYQRIRAGLLQTTKDGARTFVSGAEIERYLSRCSAAAP